MDSLEKLASAAKTEIENAHFYLGKLEESLGRMACIVDNICKKAEEANEVAEGSSPVPPKQTPPGVRISATGDMAAPNNAEGQKKAKPWHCDLTPYGIAREIVDKSSYSIPHKCIKYRCFKDNEGCQYIDFKIVSHSGTSYIALEEFSMPVVDTLDRQVEMFDWHIGSLLTVKFRMKDPMGCAGKSDDSGKDVANDGWNAI